MRVMTSLIGIVVVIIGLAALLAVNGWLAFTPSDVAAGALLLSGLFFVVPALVWRRDIPWLTSLFLPGFLAFACGAILLYAGHTSWADLIYLWVVLVLAIGLGFWAMYYLGPRMEWLRILGVICSAVGLFLISIALILFSTLTTGRMVGSFILIVLGLAVFARGFGRGHSSQLTEIHR